MKTEGGDELVQRNDRGREDTGGEGGQGLLLVTG